MRWRIGEILIQKKLIDWNQLNQALEEQQKSGARTGELLVKSGCITKTLFYGALAAQHGMQFVDPADIQMNPKAAAAIPYSIAEKYRLLPMDIRGDTLYVGVADPRQTWPQEELSHLTGIRKIKTVLCLPEAIQENMQTLYKPESSSQC